MPKKMDGVKVSVNNDSEEEQEEKPKKKKTVAKKATAKKAAPKKTAIKKAVKDNSKKEKEEPKPEKKEKKSPGKRSLLSVLVSIVVTSAIVGGSIYAWQKSEAQKEVSEIKSETDVEKMDFEKRISNLKSKLTGTETNNVELKKTLEEWKKKAELLVGAKKEFKSEEFGVKFDYPASFGVVEIATSTVASSTKAEAEFEHNEKFVLTSITSDYEKDGTSTIEMWELKGFTEKRDKYFLLGPNEDQEFEINPARVIETDLGQALLIDKNSFVIEEGADGLPVSIGGDVAVVMNLRDKEYSSLVFVDSDFGMLPLEDFVDVIKSIN